MLRGGSARSLAPYPLGEMAPPEIHELAEGFGFTVEELAINREGGITDEQMAPLWTTVLWAVPLTLAVLVVGLSALKYARGIVRVLAPIFGTFAAGLIAMFAYPPIRDLIEPSVAIVEGPVMEGRRGAVLVGAQRLQTPGKTTAALETVVPGRIYRAYHLANTKRLLSIEPADLPR